MSPQEVNAAFNEIRQEIGQVIVGQDEVIEGTLISIFAGGHVLLEGLPGLGKTLLVKTIGRALDLRFSRIQFTPDLMPADIIGTNVLTMDAEGRRHFEFQQGPVFAQVILADEINRTTPKTQSALLEAMQEGAVTVLGTRHRLPEPFFVLATQNPIELEGTYPLPEAQVDRFFFKLKVGFPGRAELLEIADRTTGREKREVRALLSGTDILAIRDVIREVPIASHVRDYAARLVLGTHPDSLDSTGKVRDYVRYGVSPRGLQALILGAKVKALISGRFNVSFADIKAVAYWALRHRIILNFRGEAEGIDPDEIISELLGSARELGEDYAGKTI